MHTTLYRLKPSSLVLVRAFAINGFQKDARISDINLKIAAGTLSLHGNSSIVYAPSPGHCEQLGLGDFSEMNSGEESPLWRLVSRRAKTIVLLGGQGNGCPFYCVHSISGEVTSLRPFAKILGSDRKIYGIQVPAEKLGSNFVTTVEEIAEYYVDTLTAFQPEGPLLLGGWSAGSVIALEMAQTLQRRGRAVHLLVVFDGILYNTGGGISRWNPLYYWALAKNVPGWIADHMAEDWGIRSVAGRIKTRMKLAVGALISRGRQPGWAVDAFLDTSRLPPGQAAFARALFSALERYKPKPYSGRVMIYAAKTQPLFQLWQVKATWAKIASGIETFSVNASHLSMLQEPQVTEMANHLREQFATLGFIRDKRVEEDACLPNPMLELNLHPSIRT